MTRTATISTGHRIKTPPAVGDYMAGSTPQRVWRIKAVTALRQAGGTRCSYRLQCETTDTVPAGATVHPWRLASPPPPRHKVSDLESPLLARMGIRDRAMLQRLQAKAPFLLALGLEPLTRARADDRRRQQQRVARIGRDHGIVDLCDQGPNIRLETVRDAAGKILRDADVVVSLEPEEPGSRRLQRRARRADPLATLLKYKSITRHQFDAAERLRIDIEHAAPAIAGGGYVTASLAPWARAGLTKRQLAANRAVREAFAEVAVEDRLALAWLVGGGTLGGLAGFAHINEAAAAEALRSALSSLVEFYGLAR